MYADAEKLLNEGRDTCPRNVSRTGQAAWESTCSPEPHGEYYTTAKVAPQEHKEVAPTEMDCQALRNSPLPNRQLITPDVVGERRLLLGPPGHTRSGSHLRSLSPPRDQAKLPSPQLGSTFQKHQKQAGKGWDRLGKRGCGFWRKPALNSG